jgi:F420H(2)-dependent quinone reductase
MSVSPLECFLRAVDRSWPVVGRLLRVHSAVYRASGGRIGARLPGVPPMLLLDHVGARSGKRRTTTLVYMRNEGSYIVLAAKGGHRHNPAWLHNLRAHPGTQIQVGREVIDVHAREADDHERTTLWPAALAYTAHWRRYARRTDRRIPLVILEP